LAEESHRFDRLLLVALLMLAHCLLFGYLLSRRLTRLLRSSIDALRSIRAGTYAVHVDVTAGGEIGAFQSSINALALSLNQFKQDLEQKVAARTCALEESRNEALKANEEKRKLI
jgi:two-component system sensor histidine kinase UhpB